MKLLKTMANLRQKNSLSENSERIAKVIARAGLCSRREAENWIQNGRVKLNGKELSTPATLVTSADKILVDGNLIPNIEPTRLWIFHKPRGTITTNKDPEGRSTVFSRLPKYLPRVISVGRLDFNTEGLLLLTNDGGLARLLELPSTGWLRQYKVRAYGRIDQARLDTLKEGISMDGIFYGSINATLDRASKENCWMTIGLREGKNREVKRILEHLGLKVNRLIRVSYGPYQLNELAIGDIIEVNQNDILKHLKDKEITKAGLVFRHESSKQSSRARSPKHGTTTKFGTKKISQKSANPKSTNNTKSHKKHSKSFDKSSKHSKFSKPNFKSNGRNKKHSHSFKSNSNNKVRKK